MYIIGRDELITHQKVDLDEAAKIDVSSYGAVTGEGPTAMHAIVAALREAYAEHVWLHGRLYSQIGDLVAGQPNYMSGWMYKLNNVFPDAGVAESSLTDGDEIVPVLGAGRRRTAILPVRGRKAAVKTGEALTLTPELHLWTWETALARETFVPVKNWKIQPFALCGWWTVSRTNSGVPSQRSSCIFPRRAIVTAKVVQQVGTGNG